MDKFHITLVKFDRPIIETYTDEEVKILLKKPNKNKCAFVEFRDWTICNVLYATGMRCSNILDLKVNEVDLYNNLLNLRTTKNRRPLALPITNALQPILREYLSVRNGNGEDYLFCTAYGNKTDRDSLYIV